MVQPRTMTDWFMRVFGAACIALSYGQSKSDKPTQSAKAATLLLPSLFIWGASGKGPKSAKTTMFRAQCVLGFVNIALNFF